MLDENKKQEIIRKLKNTPKGTLLVLDLSGLIQAETEVDSLCDLLARIKMDADLNARLTMIDLSHNRIGNQLSALTDLIQFPNLKSLNLSNCEINEAPAYFDFLPALEHLSLNDNKLQILQQLKMPKLIALSVNNNRLVANPDLDGCPKLTTAYLIDNNMRIFVRYESYIKVKHLGIQEGNNFNTESKKEITELFRDRPDSQGIRGRMATLGAKLSEIYPSSSDEEQEPQANERVKRSARP